MAGIKIKRTDVVRVRTSMLKDQRNVCPLCATVIPEGMDVLDHSHVHGHVRAVLCRNCNAMEGKIFRLMNRAKRDGTVLEWAERLIQYWLYHAEPRTRWIHHLHKTEAEKKVLALKRRMRLKKNKDLLLKTTRDDDTRAD